MNNEKWKSHPINLEKSDSQLTFIIIVLWPNACQNRLFSQSLWNLCYLLVYCCSILLQCDEHDSKSILGGQMQDLQRQRGITHFLLLKLSQPAPCVRTYAGAGLEKMFISLQVSQIFPSRSLPNCPLFPAMHVWHTITNKTSANLYQSHVGMIHDFLTPCSSFDQVHIWVCWGS